MQIPKIERALRDLSQEGFDVSAIWLELSARIESRERGVPTEDDTRFPLLPAMGIGEHLDLEKRLSQRTQDATGLKQGRVERPTFSCAIAQGRMYTLSPAQRAVLREWFNMIPSPEVEVVELSTFPGTNFVRECKIKTTPHKPHGNIENGPRVVCISRWGAFMSACAAREAEVAQQREVDTLTKRVEKLLKRAKDDGVAHDVRTAGTIAQSWHAACEEKRLFQATDEKFRQQAIRDELRLILVARGEDGLAQLVKEPFFLGERVTEKQEEYDAFVKALGL